MQDDATNESVADDDGELDDAVIAADDTGMLAGERLITVAEIEEAEETSRETGESSAGDV
ncbi:MAG TPA: hypothetical protein VFB22_00620 [Candidatus Baltobacteraceae bacterium]|nr:hypothetical protein [Candidatus Baltobacteraceae bacterium]